MRKIPSRRARYAFIISIILILVAASLPACAEKAATPLPTEAQAAPAIEPSAIPDETTTTFKSTREPAAASGQEGGSQEPALETDLPNSPILPNLDGSALILNPGQDSRVASPLKPQVLLMVHADGIVQLDLIGKGGILFARQMLDLSKQKGQEALLQPEIPFEIQQVEIPARLVVRLLNSGGLTVALTSVDLTLMAGDVSVFNSDHKRGWIEITAPSANVVAEGKKVHVTARVFPANSEPLVAELLTDEGAAVNTRLVNLPKTDGVDPAAPVDVDFFLPFAVSEETTCLLTLSQSSYKGIQGPLMLTSVPITLIP